MTALHRQRAMEELARVVASLAVLPGEEGHAVVLSDYEVANLRSLLNACGFWCIAGGPSPLSVCNTGDWGGQILAKLPVVEQAPNASPQDLCERARNWMPQKERP